MSNKRKRLRRAVAQGAGVALVAGGLATVAVGPAQADTFTPTNEAPTVSITSVSAGIQPEATRASQAETVQVTVGDPNLLVDLTTVTLCLYKSTGGDSTCGTIDPTKTVKYTWTRASNTFAPDAGNGNWNDQGSASVSNYNAAGSSMNMTFSFNASEAALQGTWSVKVTAVDTDAATDTDTSADSTVVLYHNEVKAQRASAAFGDIAAGGSATASVSSGTVLANAATDLKYNVSDFANGGNQLTNKAGNTTDVTVAPDAAGFALDCKDGGSYADVGAVRIEQVTPVKVQDSKFASGTPEGGEAAPAATCRLSYGGGVAKLEYSATVTVTAEAHS